MDPPSQVDLFLSGGATTFTFMFGGARAFRSFNILCGKPAIFDNVNTLAEPSHSATLIITVLLL